MRKAKLISILLCTVVVISFVVCALAGCNSSDKFVIYNSGDYIDESVWLEFADYYFEQTGEKINVVYSEFETNEEMLTKMEGGASNIDVICTSEYAIQRLIEKDLVVKLNKDNISTINNVDADLYAVTKRVFGGQKGEVANINDYYVPYMWGTVGIIYNSNTVTEDDLANDWGLLWNDANNSELVGQIYMKDSIRDSYLAAVLYLKNSGKLPAKYADYTSQQLINCTDSEMLAAVEATLLEQKPLIKQYEVDNGKEDLAKGIGSVCLCWSGDAFYAIDLAEELDMGAELAFLEPQYTNLFIDGWVVSKNTKNTRACELFLQYMNLPEIAMRNAVYIQYTSGISEQAVRGSDEAMEILTEAGYDVDEFFSDPYIYPDVTSDRYGVMLDFGASEADVINLWKRVKAAS